MGRKKKEIMKILLVGMADSIHLSRWISQFDSSDLIFEVVSASPHRRVQKGISERARKSNRVSITWFSRVFSLPMWIADRFLSDWVRGAYIAWRIRRFNPEIVHIHELQNAGYATRRAFQLLKKRQPKLIVTNYGSEIVWFSKFPKHKAKIKALLDIADGFSAECTRDYNLAAQISSGYQTLPLMPVAGGLAKFTGPERVRNKISIKGYENHWGKAIVALETVAGLGARLGNLEIVLYSCNAPVLRAAKKLSKSTGMKITTYKKGALSHNEVMDLFQSSLIYVGHSLSDGISTSMVEAMAMGAIPVQTNTSCAQEWVVDKKTGFIFTPNDLEALRSAVLDIIEGKFDSEAARAENYAVIDSRYNPDKLSLIAAGYYQSLTASA
jgi:glycosyltransferase involved in cell wall biosynthesis